MHRTRRLIWSGPVLALVATAAGAGSITIDSEPRKARVSIDGVEWGRTPLTVPTPAPDSLIRLEHRGHEVFEYRARAADGAATAIDNEAWLLELRPGWTLAVLRPSPPAVVVEKPVQAVPQTATVAVAELSSDKLLDEASIRMHVDIFHGDIVAQLGGASDWQLDALIAMLPPDLDRDAAIGTLREIAAIAAYDPQAFADEVLSRFGN